MSLKKTNPKLQKVYEKKIQHLEDNFKLSGVGETEAEQGLAIKDFVLARERIRRGVENGTKEVIEAVDNETHHKIKNWDSNNPEVVTAEKILKRAFSGRYREASIYAEDAGKLDQKKGSITRKVVGKSGGDKKNKETNDIKKRAIDEYLNNRTQWIGRGKKKAAAIYLAEHFPPLKMSTYYGLLKKIK